MPASNLWRSLVGAPYSHEPEPPKSFDCYSLVVWVRRQVYGMPTPLVVPDAMLCEENMQRLLELHREHGIYLKVDEPRPSDIVIFADNHVGVVVERGVLSAINYGARQVVYLDWPKIRRFFSAAYAVRLNVR